jgi:hypothetical protein
MNASQEDQTALARRYRSPAVKLVHAILKIVSTSASETFSAEATVNAAVKNNGKPGAMRICGEPSRRTKPLPSRILRAVGSYLFR